MKLYLHSTLLICLYALETHTQAVSKYHLQLRILNVPVEPVIFEYEFTNWMLYMQTMCNFILLLGSQ